MRLQVVASAHTAGTRALLCLAPCHGPGLIRSRQLLDLRSHVMAVASHRLARLFHVLLVHEGLKPAHFARCVLLVQLTLSRLSLPFASLLRVLSSVVADAGELLGDALHRFRVNDCSNVGLVLDVNLVQHHVLLVVLLTLLACAIGADVSVDTVAVGVDLGAEARLLLADVVLVGGPAHVVAD